MAKLLNIDKKRYSVNWSKLINPNWNWSEFDYRIKKELSELSEVGRKVWVTYKGTKGEIIKEL